MKIEGLVNKNNYLFDAENKTVFPTEVLSALLLSLFTLTCKFTPFKHHFTLMPTSSVCVCVCVCVCMHVLRAV